MMKTAEEEGAQVTISEKSRIPLGLVILLLGGTISIVVMLMKIDARLARIETHIPADWSLVDQQVWAMKLKNQNPALNIPDPIKVTSGNQ